MTKFDLVIFDCDGVLLDSEIIACRADAEAFTGIGYEITPEEVSMRFAGMPDEAVDAALATEIGKPFPANFRAKIKSAVIEKYRTELQPICGAETLLTSLKTAKCIASSASPAKLALGLIETELYELVYPNIFSTRLVERGKPHPDIFLYAAEKMEASPSNCIVIEDSVAGVTAAKSAGMTCIGFSGGSHCTNGHSQRLFDVGAESVVDRLEAVLSLVE
ncbi:HAD family phosphatase [uncultured Roseobacter sp.]|uniref:HAD family hydrolase n=1 Tax=uncultured Roseobacter sp. TaxID=114847 RepID=UPI002621D909|nr:HAD family phosphatase [uncultured Roseobacter sp.]